MRVQADVRASWRPCSAVGEALGIDVISPRLVLRCSDPPDRSRPCQTGGKGASRYRWRVAPFEVRRPRRHR